MEQLLTLFVNSEYLAAALFLFPVMLACKSYNLLPLRVKQSDDKEPFR